MIISPEVHRFLVTDTLQFKKLTEVRRARRLTVDVQPEGPFVVPLEVRIAAKQLTIDNTTDYFPVYFGLGLSDSMTWEATLPDEELRMDIWAVLASTATAAVLTISVWSSR